MAVEFQRRASLRAGAVGLGSIALQSLLTADDSQAVSPHFAPRAKHIIFLHMLGGPSQVDLLDPSRRLPNLRAIPCPTAY